MITILIVVPRRNHGWQMRTYLLTAIFFSDFFHHRDTLVFIPSRIDCVHFPKLSDSLPPPCSPTLIFLTLCILHILALHVLRIKFHYGYHQFNVIDSKILIVSKRSPFGPNSNSLKSMPMTSRRHASKKADCTETLLILTHGKTRANSMYYSTLCLINRISQRPKNIQSKIFILKFPILYFVFKRQIHPF